MTDTMTNGRQWETLYDDDGTLLEARQVSETCFLFLEVLDLWNATGEEEADKYHGDVSYVDLREIPEDEKGKALESCGWEDMDTENGLALAECLRSYGLRAPLFSNSGGNCRNVHREARREARRFAEDAGSIEDAMGRTVNGIGSTAGEFMRGDIFSGMARGVSAGKPEARLMAKMYGVPAETIDDNRPADWLPYLMGFQDSRGNRPAMTDPEGDGISPEYFQGYERGERVNRGEVPAPGWIQEAR